MRILAIAHSTTFGGAQISTLEFLELLKNSKSDIELRLITCDNARREFIDYAKALNIAIYRIPCRFIMNYPVMVIEEAKDLLRWADVVWISDEKYLVAPEVKRIKDVPIIAHLHSYALLCHWWGACYGLQKTCLEKCSPWRIIRCKQLINEELAKVGILQQWKSVIYKALDLVKGPYDYYRWPMRKRNIVDAIDGFIAVSKAVKDIHLSHMPELREKPFEVIYNPVNVPKEVTQKSLKLEVSKDVFLYRNTPMAEVFKGAYVLLDALQVLKKDGVNVKVVLVGGCTTAFIKRAERLGVRNMIEVHGYVAREKLLEMIALSKAVLFPSIGPEAFGLVALEANMLGVPVIASNVGGLPEIVVDNITGLLTEPRNPFDLAENMKWILNKKFDRKSVHEVACSRFRNDRTLNNFVAFIEKIL